jgi:hypothetical protein
LEANGKKNRSDHVDDLLLNYLEDRVLPDEKSKIERHLAECPLCAQEKVRLSAVIGSLEKGLRAFCPGSHELYDLATSGLKPEGSLAEHLAECPYCRSEYDNFVSPPYNEDMPAEFWSRVQAAITSKTNGKIVSSTSKPGWTDIIGEFLRRFRIPVLVSGLAAAAIVAFVLLQPGQVLYGPGLAVSSESWKKIPKPKTTVQTQGPIASILILFKKFDVQPDQEAVNSIYRGLVPPLEIVDRYRMVSPSAVRSAIQKKSVSVSDEYNILKGLNEKLGVTIAALVALSIHDDMASAEIRIIDVSSMKQIAERSIDDISRSELESRLRKNVFELMMSVDE